MNQIPQNIMNPHDPNDDPFLGLPDYSTNQVQSPLEYGSGISYFVQSGDSNDKDQLTTKQESSSSSTDEDKPGSDTDDGNDDVKGGEKEHHKKED